jgi:hypothetical protein
MRELFAVYMTCIALALVVLTLTADLDVLLLHPPMVGLVGLLSVVAPLYTMQLAALTSLVNIYVVWRMPRVSRGGYDAYDGYHVYSPSRTSNIRGALQLLTGQRRPTSRRLAVVSMALLLVCLPLAAAPHVPSTTPLIGALSSWQDQTTTTVLLAPMEVPTDAGASVIATATALPSGTTNTNAAPTATVQPGAQPTATTATATPTATVDPGIHFTVSPTTATYGGCATNPTVPSMTLTLNNSTSTSNVSWQATAVEPIPGGHWATIFRTSGTVPAGSIRSTLVTPDPLLCQLSHNGQSWHVSITTANAGTFIFTYSVSWR